MKREEGGIDDCMRKGKGITGLARNGPGLLINCDKCHPTALLSHPLEQNSERRIDSLKWGME